MNLSFFSFLMSVLFSTVFILMIHVLRNRPFFLKSFGVHTLLIMYGLCLFRMVFVIELPFTVPVGLKGAFSKTYALLRGVQVPVGRSGVDFIDILLGLWIIGAAAALIWLIWQECAIKKGLSSMHGNKNYAAERTLEKVKELSSRKLSVRVCVCPDIDTPMGLGIFQRWIYLPDEEYTEEELFYIMAHEYTHFCNRDGVIKLLTLLFRGVFWWNPAVYLLKKDVGQILEIKCDVAVIQNFTKSEQIEYLFTILHALKDRPQPPSGSPSRMATELVSRTEYDDVRERFELITRATKKVGVHCQVAFIGFAVLLTVLSYTFVLQSAFEPPAEDIYANDSVEEISTEGGYILKAKDGSYFVMLDNGESFPITNRLTLEVLVEEGLKIREE